ncbi:MAG TPA: Flp family type IVb pilin [Anaeromyxobacteraceae bacterium]|nr:Flp family type IVb pilin [Anaeromyxobacteraceae bacterium]
MARRLEALLRDDHGATAVEYAILASLIAVVVAGAVALVGQQVSGFFTSFTGRVAW